MKKFLHYFGGIVLGVLANVSFANAATLHISLNPATADLGQSVRASIALDTQGENVNAIQATIQYPSSRFALQSIEDGNSPVTFWIDAPKETTSGTVTFAGIMPGGFVGTANAVVTLVLEPTVAGNANLQIASATVLLNDGQGTPIPVALAGASVTISSAKYTGPAISVNSSSSTIPEIFTPEIASDPTIFDGKYFLAFSTTDKGSGIDHYEIAEVPPGTSVAQITSWHVAQSPYLLTDQTLSSDIYVRAVNHAGGMRTVELPAKNSGNVAWLFVIVLFGAVVAGAIAAWARKRRA